ncbi:hypothetical protein V8F20_004075 [Naviculisporaceae sp. PSN 640]
MALCKFWAQGNCRNGSSCRFEHPRNGGQSSNRFSALGNQGGNQAMDYGITADQIQKDLTSELPQWILSCYGPGKEAPEQLFGGYPREQSFEEIRLFFMEGLAKGNPQGALQDINTIYEQAQNQNRTVLNDISGAVKFIRDAAQKHPNRLDICKQGTQVSSTTSPFTRPTQTNNPFGQPAAASNPFGGTSTNTSAFGQPAALGQKPNPFGAPAFGQPAQPSTSAFGQPSALGGTSAFGKPAATSAFGQPSQPAATSAFGQPSQPAGAFGQPSALGAKPNPFGAPAFEQPAQPTSAFGQPSQPTSAFGQPAALGVKPNPFGAPAASPSPFGTAANAAQPTTSAFGQPSLPAATNPFGQPATTSPFGQPAATSTASPFGQQAATSPPAANPFGQPAAPAANPFGQPATTAATATPSPFGQPAAPAANVFAQAAAALDASIAGGGGFGQPAQPAAANPNPFGQPAAPTPTPFSQPAQAQAPAAASTPAQTGAGPYGPNSQRQHPPPQSYIVKNPNGSLQQFNGKPVVYTTIKEKQVPVIRSFDGRTTTRIWFPDGPPGYTNETEAADPKVYDDPKVQEQWGKFVQGGEQTFDGGLMPEVPPKREFCSWVF